MANQNLKRALDHAGLTEEQFAELIDVDPKTVQRWVAGRTPYRRHRATIARALDLPEHQLWPDPSSGDQAEPVNAGQEGAGDVIGSWGYSTDPGIPDPVQLLASARRQIDLLDDLELLRAPGVVETLLDRADGGCRVRLLSQDPLRRLLPFIEHPQCDVRLAAHLERLMMVHADERILLHLEVVFLDGPPRPVLLLAPRVSGGLFERYLERFQDTWERADQLAEPSDLYDHLTNDEEDESWACEWEQAHGPLPIDPQQPLDPAEPSSPTGDQQTTRRWPRPPS